MGKIKLPTDTGYILKETIKGLPNATKKVGKKVMNTMMKGGKMIGRQMMKPIDKELDMMEKRGMPQNEEQMKNARNMMRVKKEVK